MRPSAQSAPEKQMSPSIEAPGRRGVSPRRLHAKERQHRAAGHPEDAAAIGLAGYPP